MWDSKPVTIIIIIITFPPFNWQLPTMMLLLAFHHTLHLSNRLLLFTWLLIMLFLTRLNPVLALSPLPFNLTVLSSLPAHRNGHLANSVASLCCDLATEPSQGPPQCESNHQMPAPWSPKKCTQDVSDTREDDSNAEELK